MRTTNALFTAALLVASLHQASSAAGVTPTNAPAMQTATPAAGTRAAATGTVTAVDAKTGKITIKHGPVAALNWPPMTMAFAATPAQLASAHVGERIDFEFESKGMDGTLTRITPVK